MRIVLIGPAYPLRGGNALFVAHLYEALSTGHEVTVISFSRLYPGFLFPGVRQNDVSGTAIKKHPAVHVIDCLNPFTWVKAARLAEAAHPDVLVFTWWQPFFGPIVRTIASLFKRRTGKPVVIIVENVVSHEGRWIDLILTRLALVTADRFLVLSQVVERQVQRHFPGTQVFRSSLPVYDCYQVDEPLTHDEAKEQLSLRGKQVVLFFGYVRQYKGLMNIIDAFPDIRKELPDAHLLMVGEFYDDPAPYHQNVERLGLKENVTFIAEYVPNEDVHRYFTAANVTVLPYNEATQSGILSIAYGFAKPVIATNVGGLAELIDDGKTGFIVPPHDRAALTNAVVRYFKEACEQEFSRNIITKRESASFGNIRTVFEETMKDIRSQIPNPKSQIANSKSQIPNSKFEIPQ